MLGCGNEKVVSYYPNGKIRYEVVNSDSSYYEYYSNNSIESIENFKNGIQEGGQLYYYKSGVISDSINCKDGKLNGKVLKYYPNGILNIKAIYFNDKEIFFEFFSHTGKILERRLSNNDGLVTYLSKFDSINGQKTFEIIIPIIETNKDTIELGETCIMKIKFGFSLKGDLRVVIGKENNGNVFDTIVSLPKNNKTYEYKYSIKPTQKGKVKVPVIFIHNTDKDDTLSASGLRSYIDFVVK
jgi:antitoxin component YwqK of YwqJK toxin-antitoxin module